MKTVIATYLLFFAVTFAWIFWRAFLEMPLEMEERCLLLIATIAVAAVVSPLVALFLATRAWNAGLWMLAAFLPLTGLVLGTWLSGIIFWIRFACAGR